MDQESQARDAFAARCLLRAAKWASLATTRDGEPFASLVTPAVLPDGSVLMLLSAMAEHSRHLVASARCGLMVVGEREAGNANWQTAARVTVMGEAAVLADAAARRFWLARHPYARLYADFADFSLWRLMPERALFIGGFGLATKLDAASFMPAADAVAAVAAGAAGMAAHCNGTHGEALSRIAHAGGKSGAWRMLDVDTDGVDLVQDETVLRVAFDAPVADCGAAQAALLRLAAAGQRRFW